MVKMGRLYRTNFGKHRFVSKMDARELRAIEKRIAERKSLDFYGKKFNSLNPSQKRYIREKAQRLMNQGVAE